MHIQPYRHLWRSTAVVLVAAAVAAAGGMALAGSAFAASSAFCDPADPTCQPAGSNGSGPTGGGLQDTSGGGGPSYPNPDIGGGASNTWQAPLFTGTFQMQTTGGLYRSGPFAASPDIRMSTSLNSASPFGFHSCVEAVARDALQRSVYDSGPLRSGVNGWASDMFTFGQSLTVAQAKAVTAIVVNQWTC
jgi:hypothetical protein